MENTNYFETFRISTDFSGVKIEHQLENRDWEVVTENILNDMTINQDVLLVADSIFGLPTPEIGMAFETLSESHQQAKYQNVDDSVRLFGAGLPEFRTKSELKEYENYPSRIQVKSTWIAESEDEDRLSGITVRPSFRPQGLRVVLWDVEKQPNETIESFYPLHGERNFVNFDAIRVKKVFDEKSGTSDTGNDWRLVNIAVTESRGYEARVSLWNEKIDTYLPLFTEGNMVSITNAKITPQENYPPSISLYSTSEVVTA